MINFVVNCRPGPVFVMPIVGFAFMKTGEKLFELFDYFVGGLKKKMMSKWIEQLEVTIYCIVAGINY